MESKRKETMLPQKIGRWSVSDQWILDSNGAKRWLCRCDCGTERYVLERSLLYGASLSCGCLRREKVQKALSHDLRGCVFGNLLVLKRIKSEEKKRGSRWRCRCVCGTELDCSAAMLLNGKKTNCGCMEEKRESFRNIAGRSFDRLTALYPTQERTGRGSVIWHCRCSCGKELDVSYNKLVYGSIKSCGCRKKEHDAKLPLYLTHVNGTSIEMIRSKKIPKNNTTGHRGVYLLQGKYAAKIVFCSKQYYLGRYDTLTEAAAARKRAEKILFEGFDAFYRKWKQRADQEPGWAKENPIRISVYKATDDLAMIMLPQMHPDASV